MNPRIGVLAYGSLIDDPGNLAPWIVERRYGVHTPFRVEFARQSGVTRGGSPTLVPVDEGGAHVAAVLFVLGESISVDEARDLVYRREIRAKDPAKRYEPNPSNRNQVWVEVLPDWAGLDAVLYVRIAPNISNLRADRLAELAVASASGEAGRNRLDGITYLIRAKAAGVRTPLMDDYEREILRQTKAASLEEAWARLTRLTRPAG